MDDEWRGIGTWSSLVYLEIHVPCIKQVYAPKTLADTQRPSTLSLSIQILKYKVTGSLRYHEGRGLSISGCYLRYYRSVYHS